jgi:methylated-DNA-[protein]-cysteine S-methyltransferase
VRYIVVDSFVGPLTLLAGDVGLRAVLWPDEPPPADAVAGEDRILASAGRQLDEYFGGKRRHFDLPLELIGTPFQRRAWLALASIPFGATTSYAEQARQLGHPRAARAIGAANARNPVSIVLPCHRLVGARGGLTGYGGGLDAKRALLEHEARAVAEHD